MIAKFKRSWKPLWFIALLFALPAAAYAVHGYYFNIGQKNQTDAPGSAAIGFANSTAGGSLAVGFNNHIGGANSGAIGEGIVVHAPNALAAGSFNATAGRSAEAVFVVGIGSGSGDRANALEIHPNGDILIGSPQGDIPMYNPAE